MANAFVDLALAARVIPYLGVGLGVGVVSVSSDDDATVLAVVDTSVEFAWSIMVGATPRITERFSLNLGFRDLATTNQ